VNSDGALFFICSPICLEFDDTDSESIPRVADILVVFFVTFLFACGRLSAQARKCSQLTENTNQTGNGANAVGNATVDGSAHSDSRHVQCHLQCQQQSRKWTLQKQLNANHKEITVVGTESMQSMILCSPTECTMNKHEHTVFCLFVPTTSQNSTELRISDVA